MLGLHLALPSLSPGFENLPRKGNFEPNGLLVFLFSVPGEAEEQLLHFINNSSTIFLQWVYLFFSFDDDKKSYTQFLQWMHPTHYRTQ